MSATFRDLVREAFTNTLRKSEDPKSYPGTLAVELRALLRRDGYEIHAVGSCVKPRRRPGDPKELGREMTRDEMILTGLVMAGEGLDDGGTR